MFCNFPQNTLFLFILIVLPCLSTQISFNEYVTLNYDERKSLDKFKDLVSYRLPHDYMKRDIYLIAFLREVNFDISEAEEMILDMIRWREINRMDHIMEEDFSYFDQEYTAYIEGCDNESRPIVSVYVGQWDIRREIIAGRVQQLTRYTHRLFEEGEIHVRDMQNAGHNVTQAVIIADINNINVAMHICPLCIPLYLNILTTYQTKYPGYLHKIVVINTPQFALPIWDIYKHLVSPTLRNVLEIYGKNKEDWEPSLLKEIDPSQLSVHFGGTRGSALDVQDFRATGKLFKCTNDWDEFFN